MKNRHRLLLVRRAKRIVWRPLTMALERFALPLNSFLRICLVACTAMLLGVQAFAVPWVARHGLTATEYQTEFDKWTAPPYEYRPISICGYEQTGQARFVAIWEERPGPGWISHHQMTQAQFESLRADYAKLDYHPAFISGFAIGNSAYYSAIWEHLPGADVVSAVGLFNSSYVAEDGNRVRQGYKSVHVWTFNIGVAEYFVGIWRKNVAPEYAIRRRQNPVEYQQEFNNLAGQGYQLVAVSASAPAGQELHTSVWKKPGDGVAGYSRHHLSAVNYQAEMWNWEYQGYRPVLTSVFVQNGAPRFNAIWQNNGGMSPSNLAIIDDAIADYMRTNGVPGLSLAISRNGRLVYAKGWGYADVAANEWAHPHHRFRVASVSKPITSAAVLKLADCCGLSLGQTVFGPGAILGESYGTLPYSAWEKSITVTQLLHHTTGWLTDGIWEVDSDDPDDAIDWQLSQIAGEPLNAPGSFYTYMNIGYCVAGRVIETVSGRSYEQFVKDELLAPSCVTEMEIGGRTLFERKPGEVVYYQTHEGSPYDLSPSRMDAHGGWIAKPQDLLLLLRRMDSNTNQSELLQNDSLTTMRTPSMAPGPGSGGTNYGLGLGISGSGWGHNGAMPGTIADLSYRNDGFGFAVACNARPESDAFAGTLKSTIMNVINTLNSSNAWPNIDLFPCDVPPGDPPPTMAVTENLYVDGTANCPWANGKQACGLFEGPFHTVNQAVAAVCAGDRLFIRTGSYHEAVVFDRPVTVRSYDGTAVIGE